LILDFQFAISNRQSAIENRKCILCALRYFHDKGLTFGLKLTIPEMHQLNCPCRAFGHTATTTLTFGCINLCLSLGIDDGYIIGTDPYTGQTGCTPLPFHHGHHATDLEHFLREDSRRSG
jgi:hypothetical protein